jgi:hypothetical protein
MNFLNDSLKHLKTVLVENLDANVFDSNSPADGEGASSSSAQAQSNQEHENLRKLLQHQSDEVHLQCFLLFALLLLCHYCT